MLSFYSKRFDELTTEELYTILALRAEVFVVEQNCPYQDLDGKDKNALHVLGYLNGTLIAYARVLKQGISYQEYASIGRVVTDSSARGKKYGHELMVYSIGVCQKHYTGQKIKISAQAHLEKFYTTHGFVASGESYLEDGIPHIGMLLK